MYRPAIPVRIKLDVVIRQEGKCSCGCGKKLGTLKETNFDHDPPLALRQRLVGTDGTFLDYLPSPNDPRYITAMRVECHHKKTNGTAATSYGSDKHEINKANRIAEGVRKRRGKIRSRGFDKTRTRHFDGTVTQR